MTNNETSQDEAAPAYDFEYICRSFGLIQFDNGALNLGTVLYAMRSTDPRNPGGYTFYLPDQHTLNFNAKGMQAIEAALRQREADVARLRAEAIERDAQMEMGAKMRAASDALTYAKLQGQQLIT